LSKAIARAQLAWWLPALGSSLAGLALAWHHPLWPMSTSLVFGLWCAVAAWKPKAWWLLVPACLPWLNFSPWTGWLIFEEFDLLLLGALAGGYARLACAPMPASAAEKSTILWLPVTLLLLLGGSGMWSLYRGVMDAGGWAFDWFAGYTDALNSLRIFKSLGFALLFVPLMASRQAPVPARASRLLAWGMVLGLLQVTLAVLWERAAFPGVLDFSTHFRTVALFWEMHVGGAAIDAYLALATPFVVWTLIQARQPLAWMAAAALTLLTGYACLTTFSRGVYGAVLGSLVLLGVLLWTQKHQGAALAPALSAPKRHRFTGWRPKANVMLVLALLIEVAGVLVAGSFMLNRLDSTDRDLDSRLTHWQHGLDLLQQRSDWWLGIGLGRFPAHYASQVPRGEFSGTVKPGDGFVTLQGPVSRKSLAGGYALTQRVTDVPVGQLWVSMQVRAQVRTDVYIDLCERHLLYDGNCQGAFVRIAPDKQAWQTLVLPLRGPPLSGGPWHAPRLHMFSLAIANAGGHADFDNVRLIGRSGPLRLENGDFSQGLAHWFPAGQSYFVPWHMDNLFLEILVERGGLGLLLWLVMMHLALWHLAFGRGRLLATSPFFAASLCGVLLVGLVSSVMDVPRVAFLMYLLTLMCVPIRVRHARFS
jgi:hypothetical protein